MGLPSVHDICLPELGLGQQQLVVAKWYRLPGDTVIAGDSLLQVAAESIAVDVPATQTGRLVQRLVEVGDRLQAGQRLAVLMEEGSEDPPGSS